MISNKITGHLLIYSHSASLAGDQSVTTPPANNDDEKDEEDGGRIVPQLKIGADGTIQIDEERYNQLQFHCWAT